MLNDLAPYLLLIYVRPLDGSHPQVWHIPYKEFAPAIDWFEAHECTGNVWGLELRRECDGLRLDAKGRLFH